MSNDTPKKPVKVDVRDLVATTEDGRRGPGSRLLLFAGQLVNIASVLPPGEPHQSTIPCRKRPGRRPCGGSLQISRRELEDDILWACPRCGDTGLVVGWQNSRWDREPQLKSGELVSLLQVRAERSRPQRAGAPLRQAGHTFEIRVELIGGPLDLDEPVVRSVRLGGERSLHDLHQLIQKAFDREDDEPYEFMFGAPYEPDARRFAGGIIGTSDDAEEGWETQQLTLDSLGLTQGQAFGYLFDFGEEWVHRVTVVSVSKERSYAVQPRVVERVGISPPQYPEMDELWDDELLWNEVDVDDEFPLTGLYGPYDGDEPPDPEVWLAMEDLERMLLIIEAHSQELPKDHPNIESLSLHAVIHDLAETKLADDDRKAVSWLEARCRAGVTRHQAVHELGEQLVRDQLHEPPKRKRSKQKAQNEKGQTTGGKAF